LCRQFRLQLAEGDPLLREALCEPSQKLLHVGRGARAEQLLCQRPLPLAVRVSTAKPVGLRSRVSGAVTASAGHRPRNSPLVRG
jgi:hypothetical protein